MERYQLSRQKNIQTLKDRGLEILSDWDGRRAVGAKCVPLPVTVRNKQCGHAFTSNAVNLLSRGIRCSVCGVLERTSNINHWSEQNSDKWRQTAPAFKVYRSTVTKLTKATYKKHKAELNPNNLPFGRAGTAGAYHLDHIISVKYGFDNNIPPEQLAQVKNLRVIPWLENIVKRDKLIG